MPFRDVTLSRVCAGGIQAAELLGLERRQVQRLAKAYQEHGATALMSKKRGRPSNRQPNEITRALPRKKVTVYEFPDGRIEVRHQGLALPYRTFDRITRVDQGAIVENKRLSEALEMCRAMQAELPPKLRSRKAPARTSQAEHMF